MNRMFRQGDVLLVECDFPVGALDRVPRKKKGGIILAAGETTGHHHRIKDRYTRAYRSGGRRFIVTSKHGATVTHEEHDPLQLPASTTLEIVRQREYNPPKDKQIVAPTYVRD